LNNSNLDFHSRFRDKVLVGYGTGISMLGTLAVSEWRPDILIDDNPELIGESIDGIPIRAFDELTKLPPGGFHVITFGSTPRSGLKMTTKLVQSGLQPCIDFTGCHEIHFHTISDRLQNELNISTDIKLFKTVESLCLNSYLENLSTITGSWLYVEILNQLLDRTEGDIAECGVYYGGNAWVSLSASDKIQYRKYHLFDSFEGFQNISKLDPESRKDDFRQNDYDLVRALFSQFQNVRIHRGFFENTLPSMEEKTYSMAYIDCDLYEPTLYCCEYFIERLDPHGVIFLHDYWVPQVRRPAAAKKNFTGVQKAVELLGDKYSFDLTVFPESTHALLRRC